VGLRLLSAGAQLRQGSVLAQQALDAGLGHTAQVTRR
jgi:hypothetical protein